jgi:hypothetical protein
VVGGHVDGDDLGEALERDVAEHGHDEERVGEVRMSG